MPAYVDLSVEYIYNKIATELERARYIIERKNSAICVRGDASNYNWDISVDVVPGKYTQNDNNNDVYLWCNKDGCRLKSNPEKQIGYVKNSNVKDLIRLIKLYRDNKKFKFKSFYLEVFAIDFVGREIEDKDNVYDKMIKFCSHFEDIGSVTLFDPANSNNNISKIHDAYEVMIIKSKLKELYEVLLTNDEIAILNIIKGASVDIGKAYERDALSHSTALKIDAGQYNIVISCKDKKKNLTISSNQAIPKQTNLVFEVYCVGCFVKIDSVHLIISNAGYESICCPRGGEENTEYNKEKHVYWREETTSYNGNHYVQAIVRLGNKQTCYSAPFIVKVRDY